MFDLSERLRRPSDGEYERKQLQRLGERDGEIKPPINQAQKPSCPPPTATLHSTWLHGLAFCFSYIERDPPNSTDPPPPGSAGVSVFVARSLHLRPTGQFDNYTRCQLGRYWQKGQPCYWRDAGRGVRAGREGGAGRGAGGGGLGSRRGARGSACRASRHVTIRARCHATRSPLALATTRASVS